MSKVKFLYQHILQNFPRRHALAIVGVSTGTILALSLMPGKSAEATDNRRHPEELSLLYLKPSTVVFSSHEKRPKPQDLIPEASASEGVIPDLLAPTVARAAPADQKSRPTVHSATVLAPAVIRAAPALVKKMIPPSNRKADPQLAWQKTAIRKGDTLSSLFTRSGLALGTLLKVVRTSPHGELLADIRPEQTLSLGTLDGELKALRLERSLLESIEYTLNDDGTSYDSKIVTREPNVEHAYVSATINNSLFVAAANAGVPESLIMNLADIFGWDIDFVMDIRANDSFSLVYEEQLLDDKHVGYGNILAATFTNQGKTYQAVYYEDDNGNGSYYTPDGKSMRKSFLRTPVDFTRISSRFNPDRLHPIYKTRRPHRGVDYAAPTGTPIKAAGDGVIEYSGWKSGYGNVVYINHPNEITTIYAHQSRLAGFKKGQRVKQGQTIGYVGQTGWATGPHLHYEFQVRGVHRNPLTVKLPDSMPLPEADLAKFQQRSATLMAELSRQSVTLLASAKDNNDVITQ